MTRHGWAFDYCYPVVSPPNLRTRVHLLTRAGKAARVFLTGAVWAPPLRDRYEAFLTSAGLKKPRLAKESRAAKRRLAACALPSLTRDTGRRLRPSDPVHFLLRSPCIGTVSASAAWPVVTWAAVSLVSARRWTAGRAVMRHGLWPFGESARARLASALRARAAPAVTSGRWISGALPRASRCR